MSHRQTPSHKQTSRIRDRGPRRERRRAVSLRPGLESLETRRLLSDFFDVTTTADSGPGSLRQAILDLNQSHDTAFINFDIGPGVQTIRPASALPIVSHPVDIDGSSLEFSNQVVVINGSLLNGASGLSITAGSSTVSNLVINGFTDGLNLTFGGGNLVEGCMFGTNAAGTAAVPNSEGIFIQNSSDNTIGGTTAAELNLISGNDSGVGLADSALHNVIEGNFIGTDITGTKPLGNRYGVLISKTFGGPGSAAPSDNTIGGLLPQAGNLISGNTLDGIQLYHSPRNIILNNLIGTTVDGNSPLGNSFRDIALSKPRTTPSVRALRETSFRAPAPRTLIPMTAESSSWARARRET